MKVLIVKQEICRQFAEPYQLKAQRVGDAGFTLLEMLIVLALMAIATTASTVSFRGGPNQVALLPVAALVAADLRSARAEAMQHSRVVEVRFDGRARTYLVQGAQSVKRLPDTIGFAFLTNNEGLRADYADRLLFFPDGSSTGGAVTLSSKATGTRAEANQSLTQRAIVLSVDWLTGTVRQAGR
jgi:general secretion pathway protein H